MTRRVDTLERKLIIEQISEILDTYCQDCFVKSNFRKEYGKTYAQSFCIHTCTVGNLLKKYGENLSHGQLYPSGKENNEGLERNMPILDRDY